jgi:histone H3/H4
VSFLAERAENRVIVRSAVRELVKGKFNVSDEFFKRLDTDVAALVTRAADRAKENGRKTLKARDA